MSKNQTLFETVAYIYIQDKKVLLVKSRGKDAFYMPGGKKEEGEDNIAALTREVIEELTVKVEPSSIQHFGQFEAQAYGKPDGVTVRIICYVGEHTGELTASSEIADIAFFSYEEYFGQTNTAPAVKLILDKLKKDKLID